MSWESFAELWDSPEGAPFRAGAATMGFKVDATDLEKCPGCALVLPASDIGGQWHHMTTEHPDIVADRLREAMRWDGWEDID